MTFLRKLGNTFRLLDDKDVQKVLIRVSEEGSIRTVDLLKKTGITKESTFYNILKELEDAELIQKNKLNNVATEYSITGLYNVAKIDKWLDGTYRSNKEFEADFFKNLVLRLKLQYE